MPAWLIPAIAGATSLVGGLLGNSSNRSAQNSANRANMELAKYQYSTNVDMWNKQNFYNSPQQQMDRLKNAGLNPNLVYGNGSVVGNTTSSAPEYKAPHIQAYTGNNFGISEAAGSALQAYQAQQQVENLKSSNEYTKTQSDALKNQMTTETLRQAELGLRNARSKFDLDLASELRNNSLEVANQQLLKMKADTARTYSDIDLNQFRGRLTDAQIANTKVATAKLREDLDIAKFENALKKIGIYPSDRIWEKILGQAVNYMLGGNPVQKGVDWLKDKVTRKPNYTAPAINRSLDADIKANPHKYKPYVKPF